MILMLSSLNVVSLFFFFVTLAFLFYEVMLLYKEKQKLKRPTIPNFDDQVLHKEQTVVVKKQTTSVLKKSNNMLITVLIILVILFGLASIVGYVQLTNNARHENVEAIKEQIRKSRGIIVYNTNFVPLNEEALSTLRPGDTVIVGIEKVVGADIDKARFLIAPNKPWSEAITSTDYNAKNNVYFIRHTVATGSAQLYLRAQLHSQKEGWLGK